MKYTIVRKDELVRLREIERQDQVGQMSLVSLRNKYDRLQKEIHSLIDEHAAETKTLNDKAAALQKLLDKANQTVRHLEAEIERLKKYYDSIGRKY